MRRFGTVILVAPSYNLSYLDNCFIHFWWMLGWTHYYTLLGFVPWVYGMADLREEGLWNFV